MPNNNSEEPLPLAGEAAPAPVSIPDDSVSEVNDQLASTTLSDQDEATPPADAAAGDTNNPKEDPDLWKPHPPKEECPVCLVPLPLKNEQSIYWSCCGKKICNACREEHKRALNVTNRKREKKKLPPLEFTCPFCRSPLAENDAEVISRHEDRVDKGDTVAMLNLAGMYMNGTHGLQEDETKQLELFHRAADLGSKEANLVIGRCFLFGQVGVKRDEEKAREWFESALKKGDVEARNMLAILLADEDNEDNYGLVIEHWHLAAAAGHDDSVKNLWNCFSMGKLSKPGLEKALRAHKAASDEMKSEERERFAAYEEAQAGNDELLKHIYGSYYLGYINAKDLKVALKAHRAGDRMAVEILLQNKIYTDK